MDMADALQTFLAESRGLLQEMEDSLLLLEDSAGDRDALNAVFRAAHTIKGSAGLFGFEEVVAFTHRAENVLDKARDGELPVDDGLTGLMLDCRDHIEQMLDRAANETPLEAELLGRGEALSERLARILGEEAVAAPTAELAAAVDTDAQAGMWHISLRFGEDVLRNGMDPLSFVRYLNTLGRVDQVAIVPERLPAESEIDPESCYLGFEIRFDSDADQPRIESVFEFVREDCALRILPPGSDLAAYRALLDELPERRELMVEILAACGAIETEDKARLLDGRNDADAEPIAAGNATATADKAVGAPAVPARAVAEKKAAPDNVLLRVQARKLDELINLVGEMVIAGAGVTLLAGKVKDSGLNEAVSGLARLVEEIRDGAMRLRMVEIGETFSRFRRVVRDVSRETGKDIELVIRGAETELDKTVVDRIGDPLTHLVRNAVDHGIEPAEQRAERGKPSHGTVMLNAYHESGGIVIEVADDGGGLNRDKILEKARRQGLIGETEEPPDEVIWRQIFEPGFSTCAQVSNLSGRGVGMDVVRRGIEALRGTVEIDSRPGEGSVFRIRLPLSLAIIDGFLMRVGEGHFVVPLDMVLECVELPESLCDNPGAQEADSIRLRDEVLPLLRLREHFQMEGPRSRRQNVVVVQWGHRKAGLVVDELEGELQAVIKPLGELFTGLRGISGSTILGSGEVALVLDVPVLLDEAERRDHVRASGSRSPLSATAADPRRNPQMEASYS